MATTLAVPPADNTSENIESHPQGSRLTRKLLIAMSAAVALHMSPGLAQTDSGRVLQSGELPKVVNIKKGDTHTDEKPSMDGKKTWKIISSVQDSSPSVTLDGTKGFGQVVQLQDGSKKSFAEISGLPKEEKEKIINGMTDDDFKKYELWMDEQKQVANQTEKQVDTNIQVANQRIETKKQVEQVANQRIETKKQVEQVANQKKAEELAGEQFEKEKNNGKRAELIKTYYAYVANIEAGAGGERAVLEKILEREFTPPDLKQRVENLLSRKDIKLALR